MMTSSQGRAHPAKSSWKYLKSSTADCTFPIYHLILMRCCCCLLTTFPFFCEVFPLFSFSPSPFSLEKRCQPKCAKWCSFGGSFCFISISHFKHFIQISHIARSSSYRMVEMPVFSFFFFLVLLVRFSHIQRMRINCN